MVEVGWNADFQVEMSWPVVLTLCVSGKDGWMEGGSDAGRKQTERNKEMVGVHVGV